MTTLLHSGGPLVLLQDVHVTLGSTAGPVNILRGVSVEIGAGEKVSVVGPSGSGKSTLMMVLGGLEQPSAGRVEIDGNDLGALGEDALARLRRARIGIVFQSFHLIPTMTALENVAIPLELDGRHDAFETATEPREEAPHAAGRCPLEPPAQGGSFPQAESTRRRPPRERPIPDRRGTRPKKRPF